MNKQIPKTLIAIAVALFTVFVLGILWLGIAGQQAAAGGTFGLMTLLSFAAGLSMIVLPCTLPLAFIIVPMAMGKDWGKGFMMAVLFGLGLTIMISIYGVASAYLGQTLGISRATPILLAVAGVAAYVFGLSELGLFRLGIPYLATIMPQALQKRGDYSKSFGLGLLLGNAGVGCPNPLFYVLLLYIAGTGSLAAGGFLGLIHGIGRALPIILLVVLAMFGIQATKTLSEKRFAIERVTAWLLILIGAFLIPAGVFNLRGWWVLAPEGRAIVLALGLLALPLVWGLFRRKGVQRV